jgi:hypothetical protein
MKQIAFWASMIFITTMADQARSADTAISALENCFKASRLSDAVCAGPENSPQQRIACYQKAQAAQLTCLEHISSDATGSTPSTETAGAASAQAATQAQGPVPAQAPANPPEPAGAAVQPPSQAAAPPVAAPAPAPVAVATASPAATAQPDPAAKAPAPPAMQPATDWVVTETTSPIDYSPVVIATIRSPDSRQDAPSALSIQCRQHRPEISLRTDGAWKIAPAMKVQVGLQMKDRSPWNLSVDGKVATTTDHAADLLQSLSEGTTLMVTVSDGVDHAAAFRLTGLDAIRRKVMMACRPPPPADSKASLVKR